MPKITSERRTERREEILDGARRCFAEHGYEGATVTKLEREIGLSRGAIFNYFSSKDDLFLELARRDNERLVRLWMDKGWEATLREVVEEDPDWIGVYLELSRKERTDPELQGGASSAGEELAPALDEHVEEQQRARRAPRRPRPRRSSASSASSPTGWACSWAAVSRFATSTRSSRSCAARSDRLPEAELVRVRLRVHAA